MTKHEILTLIADWQNHILRIGGIEREYEAQILDTIGSKPIKIITGFRRTGKSFLVQRLANKLIQEKRFPVSNVLYLNFEDFRLMEINIPDRLDDVYQIFKTEVAQEGDTLLIFDEIQKVAHWDRFIRTVYERDVESEMILTGSNSELLSSEIGSNLAGRFKN
jgi:predicted AAA+ superfamily ATPase